MFTSSTLGNNLGALANNLGADAASLPPDYVPAGSNMRWAAVGYIWGLTTYDQALVELRAAIEASGFYDVQVGGSRSYQVDGINYSINATLSTPNDFSRLSDVRDRLTQIAQGKGWTFQPLNNSVVFLYRATPGTTPQSPVQPTNKNDGQKTDKDVLGSIENLLKDTPLLGIGFALIALLIVMRR